MSSQEEFYIMRIVLLKIRDHEVYHIELKIILSSINGLFK